MIEVLKQALEALNEYVDVVVSVNDPNDWGTVADGGKPARDAITSLRQAIAELESQEPVAWLRTSGIGSPVVTNEMFNAYPEMRLNFQTPLYTHPQRTWVGLTDEEISQLWLCTSPYFDDLDFARAIEAKLKEKNT